ncbi:PH domain-containing protein [Corynebacterium incognita]|nr:PH domain-containing protein [Corynebacterium incognita]
MTKHFRPDRTHILAIALLSGIALIGIGWAPKYLAWLFVVPILCIWWVVRSRTTVSDKGIDIAYGFRGDKHLDWEDVEGIGFQRSSAFVQSGQKKFSLPGVTFNSLPKLAEASRGRIPDALTAGREAANDKVVVIHRDGRQVLVDKDEFDSEHPATTKDV